MALSPTAAPAGQLPLLAAFVPELKGSPAGAGIYRLDGAGEPQPMVRKSFFRTQGKEEGGSWGGGLWGCSGDWSCEGAIIVQVVGVGCLRAISGPASSVHQS